MSYHVLDNSKKTKLQKYLKKAFSREFSDVEILEIENSLYFFARVKNEYLKYKKRVSHEE